MKKTKSQMQKFKAMFIGKNGLRARPTLFVLLFTAIGIALLVKSFAATGQIYLAPSTASVEISQQTTIALRINPGTAVIGVNNVVLTYDPAKLQYVSVDFTGSPFDTGFTADGTGYATSTNTITFNRGTFASAGVSSDALIANVTFKALVGTGNTSLSVTGNAGDNATGAPTDPAGGSALIAFSSPVVVTNGMISGVVASSNGSPLSGVAISTTVNGSKRSVKTDSTGNYTIPNLPAGTYTVKYNIRKYQSQTLSIAVTAGSVTIQNLSLQPR